MRSIAPDEVKGKEPPRGIRGKILGDSHHPILILPKSADARAAEDAHLRPCCGARERHRLKVELIDPMRRLWRRPPGVGAAFCGVPLGATRNGDASHLEPGSGCAKGDVVGLVSRQPAGCAHNARYAEATECFHRASADVLASYLGRFTGGAHLWKCHADTALCQIHSQGQADWPAAHDQDFSIDAGRQRGHPT
jgi:hypothetical protein